MFQTLLRSVAVLPLLIMCVSVQADEDPANASESDLDEITVQARRVANDSPASSYAAPATALRFDPLTELQSRGLAEGQSDVTVRGGLFENTGFKLGAVTVIDPQTGHYVAELPVDPALMSTPAILKGIDSAIDGFNSAIATVSYSIPAISNGGAARLGAGSDGLNFQSLRIGRVLNDGYGIALSVARSEGDGSLPFGDHEFSRFNVLLQRITDRSQTDAIVSYQDKFYGWPGAYTGFASLPEIDDTQTSFLLLNHRREWDDGWFEAGAFYRRLEDDYDFNRTTIEIGVPGSFEHETKVMALGFQGSHNVGRIDWRYGGQITKDELVRSTDLTNGSFTDRTYATLSVVPTINTALDSGSTLTWRAGLSIDHSNRDDSEVSPLLGVSLSDDNGTTYSVEYAATSQVPGYTALNSNPTGLFGGNPLLGRETAKQLSASIARDTGNWQVMATLFSRRDEDLVDWTYATGAPFARQANAVDIDVIGFEVFYIRKWDVLDLALGYVGIDKDADYGTAVVDASFYALNFARHRATVAVTWRINNEFELRADNEYRVQEDNPLRVGDDTAYLASASLQWTSTNLEGLGVALIADNITDSEYQPFPGTPASGRQYSLSASFRW